MTETARYDVLIVGAGWSGMMALHHMRTIGLSARLIEAGSDVGGTWYWNRYPGLRCDIESMHYSYSFDDDLQQEWVWSERYPSQPELLRYAQHVADRFDLRRDIQFNTRVTSMDFDAADDRWRVTCDTGDTLEARWCIMGTGALSTPKPLDIAGMTDFAGSSIHTATWPEEGVDMSGRRVAIIGTGSSGIQAATEIAKDAAELFVLQRTPSYSMPAHNRDLTADEVATTKSNYAQLREAARNSLDGLALPSTGTSALDASQAERDTAFQEIYDDGIPFRYLGVYNDILVDPAANATAATFVANRIRDIVQDPATAATLIPSGYPFGTRRLCIDSGYYEIFNQPNVHLVDVLRAPIERITATGISTTDTEIEVDCIVYATGYDAFTGTLTRITIRGIDGVTLADSWKDGAHAYLGLMVAGFPNLFTVTGPQSPSVLSNMIVSIEQHVEWITECLDHMHRTGHTRIEATREAEQAWIAGAREIADFTLHSASTSWYSGANISGKPRVVLPYLGGVGGFRAICNAVAADDYRGFTLSTVLQPA